MATTKTYVIQEVAKSVDDAGLETQLSTQQILQSYNDQNVVNEEIADETTTQTIYSKIGQFSFIEFTSDQTVTVDFQEDGVTFFTGDVTHFRTNLSGDKLSVTITNDSGYTANVKLLVLTETVVVP